MRGALKDTRVDAGLRSCRQSLALINAQSLNYKTSRVLVYSLGLFAHV
jgi:hypothetical protein